MSKPYDATTRHRLEIDPRAWLAYVGVQTSAHVELINSDLSTITTEADKVIRIDDPSPWLVHIELQTSYDTTLPLRLTRYNVLLDYRHRLPVLSVLVLLRPEADGLNLDGVVRRRLPEGSDYLDFRYRVVRAWQQPVDIVLKGGAATLPLAPLADVTPEKLADVVRQIDERLDRELPSADADSLWAATFILMGLRYSIDVSKQLLQAARNMKESSTYQFILKEGQAKGRVEGKVEEAKRMLLLIGRRRFGPPTVEVHTAIEAVEDVDQLEALTERLLDAADWNELLSGS